VAGWQKTTLTLIIVSAYFFQAIRKLSGRKGE